MSSDAHRVRSFNPDHEPLALSLIERAVRYRPDGDWDDRFGLIWEALLGLGDLADALAGAHRYGVTLLDACMAALITLDKGDRRLEDDPQSWSDVAYFVGILRNAYNPEYEHRVHTGKRINLLSRIVADHEHRITRLEA